MAKILRYEEAVAALPGWSISAVQALGFEADNHRPLVCDGKVGPRTLGGFFVVPDEADMAPDDHVGRMVQFVREERKEDVGVNNGGVDVTFMWYGDGPVPNKRPGAWCAATVSRALILAGTLAHLGFDVNVGARRLTDELRDGQVPMDTIRRGDIIAWAVPRDGVPYGGHIGVVLHRVGDTVYVVEGNGSAARGQVRVYRYELPTLAYGKEGQHRVWRVVRPAAVRRLR